MVRDKYETALRKYRFVSKAKNIKFKYLPEWVLSEASYFEKEIMSPTKNHKIYKRGSLIFIDFGINVGNELSGNHFAIVLNKKDSKNNGVLTVLPVSSKGNKFSVEIDGLISQKSANLLKNSVLSVGVESKMLGLMEIKDYLTPEEKEEMATTSSDDGELTITHKKYISRDVFDKSIERLLSETEEISRVAKIYLKFDKVSYAKCLDIRTISKDRIIRINKFDPVGKIFVSKDTLDKIDRILVNNFTNFE